MDGGLRAARVTVFSSPPFSIVFAGAFELKPFRSATPAALPRWGERESRVRRFKRNRVCLCGHAPRVSALSDRTGACSCFILPCSSYPPLAFKKPVVLSSWLRATCTWVWCHRTTVCAFFVTMRAAVIAILAHICIPAVRCCCRPAVSGRERIENVVFAAGGGCCCEMFKVGTLK